MASLFGILGILFLLYLDFKIVRNLASPLFLAGGGWVMLYVFLLFFAPFYISEDFRLLVFFACFACFCMGYKVFTSGLLYKKTMVLTNYAWKPFPRFFLIISMYVFSAITIAKCWGELNIRTASIWQTMIYCMNETDLFEDVFSLLFINLIPVVFIVSFAMYMYNPIKENRNNLMLMFPPVFSILLFSPRGGWFFFLVSLVYIYVFVRNISNKKIVMFAIFMLVVMLFIWGLSSLDKYSTSYIYMNDFEKLGLLFSSYFVSPAFNLLYLFDHFSDFGNGVYTFRFFCAVFSKLFPDIEVVETISPFVYANGLQSNVYTAIGWVYRDFGIIWSFFVFFALGIFYGFLYKKVIENRGIISVVFLSIMMTPIAYFFFDDVLFSRFSLWFQKIIFLLILSSPIILTQKK